MARARLLLTGASGFLGGACLKVLAGGEYEVHAVSSKARKDTDIMWHRCDLLQEGAAETLVRGVGPTHLLHLAWIARPGVFWTSRLNEAWLRSSTALVSAFYALGGERAVGVGSCAEYGPSAEPCDEDRTPVAPATPYGKAKAAMHEALRESAGGRSWAWARLFFPFGPGEAGGRFISSAIDGLMRGVPVPCTHGLQVRDFIYVEDAAAALVALLRSNACGAYNVGSGEAASVRQVGEMIACELGQPELLRFGALEAPAGEPAFLVADLRKARSTLGWSPRIRLAEGIRRTIAARAASRWNPT